MKSNFHEKIDQTIEELISVLNKKEISVGASAMVYLLIENTDNDKESWLQMMSEAWDFYEKEKARMIGIHQN